MRFLALFATAAFACAQTLPPLVDIQNSAEWITNTQLSAVQTDAGGDVYFAGVVPTRNTVPATYRLGPGGYDIVVFKLDAQLQQIRYITVIGGSGADALYGMQVDAEGHVFLAGVASPGFPVTKRLPGVVNDTGGFVLRLSAGGDKVDYGVLMPMQVRTLALGVDGGIYAGGFAQPGQFTATPSTYLTQPPDKISNYGYVLKLRAADGEIEFATWLAQHQINSMAARRGGGVALAIDAVLVGLNSAGSQADFTTPLESYFNIMATDASGNFYVHTASDFGTRLSKYSPGGERTQAIDFGAGFLATTIAVSEDGTTYLSGIFPPNFRTKNSLEQCISNDPPFLYSGTLPSNGLMAVSRTGSVTYSGFTSLMFKSMIVAGGGRYVYGTASLLRPLLLPQGVFRLDTQQIPATARLSPACLAHGASYLSGPVTPGEIMTIYGSGIGPEKGLSFGLVNGRVPTDLAGVGVTVDGVQAPVLYAQDAQINFIVPWSSRTSGSIPVCVTRGADRACMSARTTAMDAAVFGDAQGPIVALPDGTRTNHVPSGGYFTIYLTGTGQMDGSVDDGGVSGLPLRHIMAQGRASLSLTPSCALRPTCPQFPEAQISYAGNSPGLVWGVTQMNVKLPDLDAGSYDLTLSFPSLPALPKIRLEVFRSQQ